MYYREPYPSGYIYPTLFYGRSPLAPLQRTLATPANMAAASISYAADRRRMTTTPPTTTSASASSDPAASKKRPITASPDSINVYSKPLYDNKEDFLCKFTPSDKPLGLHWLGHPYRMEPLLVGDCRYPITVDIVKRIVKFKLNRKVYDTMAMIDVTKEGEQQQDVPAFETDREAERNYYWQLRRMGNSMPVMTAKYLENEIPMTNYVKRWVRENVTYLCDDTGDVNIECGTFNDRTRTGATLQEDVTLWLKDERAFVDADMLTKLPTGKPSPEVFNCSVISRKHNFLDIMLVPAAREKDFRNVAHLLSHKAEHVKALLTVGAWVDADPNDRSSRVTYEEFYASPKISIRALRLACLFQPIGADADANNALSFGYSMDKYLSSLATASVQALYTLRCNASNRMWVPNDENIFTRMQKLTQKLSLMLSNLDVGALKQFLKGYGAELDKLYGMGDAKLGLVSTATEEFFAIVRDVIGVEYFSVSPQLYHEILANTVTKFEGEEIAKQVVEEGLLATDFERVVMLYYETKRLSAPNNKLNDASESIRRALRTEHIYVRFP